MLWKVYKNPKMFRFYFFYVPLRHRCPTCPPLESLSSSIPCMAISPNVSLTFLDFVPHPLISFPIVAESVKAGVEAAGGQANIYQYAFVLSLCPMSKH